jgi:endonuclease/exonuclease/phosphatase family metal-dependent hydrolase
MALVLVTWNLQGSHGLDVATIATRLRLLAGGDGADVIALQEVQRQQARDLAHELGMAHRWVFKHWPIRRRAEGLAVLSRHPIVHTARVRIQRAPFWSWRRRVALLALVTTPDGQFGLADVHLSAHDAGELRRAEAVRVLEALERFGTGRPAIVAGDLNDDPGRAAHAVLTGAGWRDAWAVAAMTVGTGATCWSGDRSSGAPPTRRIDYLLFPEGWVIDEAALPAPGPDTFRAWAELSDHLPLWVTAHRNRSGR